ncbi:hypothetical protein, partial [Enterobacter hormaechei]|uniref:hypothetical protein n=1 Tax=Enterobacter hormaechei TaxID=158836 RepID=UPI003D6E6DB4
GLTETLRRFTAGPGRRCKPSFILKVALLLQLKNYWGFLSLRGEGANTKNGNQVAVLLLPS